MEKTYTENLLIKLKKEKLIKIAAANGIDLPTGATNNQIIDLIVEKGCPIEDEAIAEILKKEPSLPKFTKEQLLKSSTYSHRRDVLRVLLDDEETYTHADIAQLLKSFYEKKVQ